MWPLCNQARACLSIGGCSYLKGKTHACPFGSRKQHCEWILVLVSRLECVIFRAWNAFVRSINRCKVSLHLRCFLPIWNRGRSQKDTGPGAWCASNPSRGSFLCSASALRQDTAEHDKYNMDLTMLSNIHVFPLKFSRLIGSSAQSNIDSRKPKLWPHIWSLRLLKDHSPYICIACRWKVANVDNPLSAFVCFACMEESSISGMILSSFASNLLTSCVFILYYELPIRPCRWCSRVSRSLQVFFQGNQHTASLTPP